jgi:hypothetical protein
MNATPRRYGGTMSYRILTVMIVLQAAMLQPPSLLAAQMPPPPDIDAAARALGLYEEACLRDGGALWGVSLCGPVVLVHPPTRTAVANAGDPHGLFEPVGAVRVGRWPDEMMIANTAIDWGGRRWAMAMLPLPDSAHRAVALLAHESFHRVQPQLQLRAVDAPAAHLDERESRIWLRLELRALAAAVQAPDATARLHVRNAVQFRAHRHSLFPGADTLEAALELHEGLAEYTGYRLAGSVDEAAARAAAALPAFERRQSFIRSLGYGTGPALGLLLDRFAPGWRTRVAMIPSLAQELRRAVAMPLGALDLGAARAAAQEYGYRDVVAAEDSLIAERAARVARYRALLVDGPLVELPLSGSFTRAFNPNQLVALDENGTVYPTGVFTDLWGRLEVSAAALLSADMQTLFIPVATDASVETFIEPADDVRTLETPSFRLELAAGWRLQPAADRPGSYRLVPRE